MTDPTPIAPDVAVVAPDRLLEKLNRRYARFTSEQGQPVAFALVLMEQEGTTECFFQTEGFAGAKAPGRGGWRGFLALAGARLTALSLADDD